MKSGQTVYTVNAKTNAVDEWEYVNTFHTLDGKLAHLRNGKKYIFIPLRCVYETREKALEVAEIK